MIKTQGMTLIEILIVIAIIGILATMMIPNLMSSRNRAQDVNTQSYLRTVTIKQIDYQLENGFYANDVNLLENLPNQTDIVVEVWQVTATDFCIQAKHTAGRSFKVSANGMIVKDIC